MTVLNTPVYVGSDAGVFNAIFYQMSLGRKLYRDVFDIKEPLFFHGYAFFRHLFGIGGPMLWETLLTLLTIGVLFRIAWRAGLSAGMSLCAVLTYLLFYFNPDIYQPLHTYHQALFLMLLAFALALEDRPVPAGAAVALALWSKATLATFIPALAIAVSLPLVRRHGTGALPRLLRFAAGGALVGLSIVVFLAVRSELRGYRDVVQTNFEYTELISAALNWKNDPVGRTAEVVGRPMLVVLAVATGIIGGVGAVIVHALRRRGHDPSSGTLSRLGLLGIALGCLAGTTLILFQAAWFNHYFASLAPGAFFVAIALGSGLRLLPLHRMAAFGSWAGAVALPVAALATGFFPTSALSYHAPSCPVLPGSDVHDPQFVHCLRGLTFESDAPRTFAIVGPNSSDSPAASMPKDFRLGCRLFFQFPWHGHRLLNEFADCLDGDVDVVVAENLIHFEQPRDQVMARRIDSIIRGRFDLVGQCGRFMIWERRTLRSAAGAA